MNIFREESRFIINDFIYNNPTTLGPRHQLHLQLVYVYAGRIEIELDGFEHALSRRDAILLVPGSTATFRFAEHEPTHHGWCELLNPDLTESELERLRACSCVMRCSEELMQLDRIAQAVPPSDHGRISYQNCLIEAMLRDHIYRTGKIPEDNPNPRHPAVERSVQYLVDHLHKPITVKDLAAQVGQSEAHLIRLFHKAGLPSPKQYLTILRCQEAARLLVSTGLSVSEIAYRTGFANPYHFSRVFSRRQRLPPGRFRKMKWRQ